MGNQYGLPIPDQWRVEYPYYIGNRKFLQCLYISIIFISLIVFAGYGYYLYEYNQSTETAITYDLDDYPSNQGWDCISLVDYDGTIDFTKYIDSIDDISVYYASISQGDVTQYSSDEQGSFWSNTANLATSQELDTNSESGSITKGRWDIYSASSFGTLEECIDRWSKKLCEIDAVNSSYSSSAPLSTYDVTIAVPGPAYAEGTSAETYFGFNDIVEYNYYDYRSGYVNWTIPPWYETNWTSFDTLEGYIYAKFDIWSNLAGDFCVDYINFANNSVESDICFTTISMGDFVCIDSEFDTIRVDACTPDTENNNYCYYDLSTVFNEENVIVADTENYEYFGVAIEVDDGSIDCTEFWNDTCREYVINEWCDVLYASPFQCDRTVRREITDIIPLSFALTELVLTVFLVTIAFIVKRICCNCCPVDQSEYEIEHLMKQVDERIEHRLQEFMNSGSAGHYTGASAAPMRGSHDGSGPGYNGGRFDNVGQPMSSSQVNSTSVPMHAIY